MCISPVAVATDTGVRSHLQPSHNNNKHLYS